jgi:hypothetical protein
MSIEAMSKSIEAINLTIEVNDPKVAESIKSLFSTDNTNSTSPNQNKSNEKSTGTQSKGSTNSNTSSNSTSSPKSYLYVPKQIIRVMAPDATTVVKKFDEKQLKLNAAGTKN